MKKLSQKFIENKFKEKQLILLENYINCKTKIKTKCFCGNIFYVIPDSVLRNKTYSCGCITNKLISVKNTTNIIGQKFNRLSVIMKDKYIVGNKKGVYWICLCDCGNTISVPTGVLKNNNTKSCGCLNIEIATLRLLNLHPLQKNKNHPSYNINLTDEDRLDKRDLFEYKQWIKNVFLRDNFMCLICKSSKNIVAHHKNGYHWCREQRLLVSNGVTLCKYHHIEFHRKYGYRNNTEIQFQQYLNE